MTDRIEAIRARHAARLRTRAARGDGSTQMSTLVDDDVAVLLDLVNRQHEQFLEMNEVINDQQERIEDLNHEIVTCRVLEYKARMEEAEAGALERAADEAHRRREKYLESPSLSMDWVAGWHAAVDDVTATLRALAPVALDAEPGGAE